MEIMENYFFTLHIRKRLKILGFAQVVILS